VLHPAGHARNRTADLEGILRNKFRTLGAMATDDVDGLIARFSNVAKKSAKDVAGINDFRLEMRGRVD